MRISNQVKKRALVILVLMVALVYSSYWAFFDIQRIKGQELLGRYLSPNKRYEVTMYLNNGGATVNYAVLGAVKKKGSKISRNIYWQYDCEQAMIEWVDDRTVKINGRILDVEKDTYDYRRE